MAREYDRRGSEAAHRADTPPDRDAMPSPGGVEFWGILRLIVDRVNGARWWPRGARLGDLGGEPEVSQDSLDHHVWSISGARRSRPSQRGQA
jgi:hypothetical protein